MKLSFPILYRTKTFLKAMGSFASLEVAEQTARQLNQYQGWSSLQQSVFKAGIEQKPDGRWGSKFVVQARDQIFEDVMRVAGLCAPIALPTLFLQPEKGQGPQRLAAFALQNLSKELTKKPGSGQSLAVFGVPLLKTYRNL